MVVVAVCNCEPQYVANAYNYGRFGVRASPLDVARPRIFGLGFTSLIKPLFTYTFSTTSTTTTVTTTTTMTCTTSTAALAACTGRRRRSAVQMADDDWFIRPAAPSAVK